MKINLKEDTLKKEYEVIGIVILKNKNKLMFILLDEIEYFYSDIEVIDGRIPINWHMKILNDNEQFLAILGVKELTYSIDLIEWNFHAYTEAMEKMKKVREKVKSIKLQEKLDYYDEYLDYTKILNSMKYKFLKNEKGGIL